MSQLLPPQIPDPQDFPEFAQGWVKSLTDLLQTLSEFSNKKEQKLHKKLLTFLRLTESTFRLSLDKRAKPDSLASFCQGKYRILAPYLDNYTIDDLSDLTSEDLIMTVPAHHRLRMTQLINERLSPYLEARDPFQITDRSHEIVSVPISIGEKKIEIQEKILDLSSKVVGIQLSQYTEKRVDIIKLSDIAQNVPNLTDKVSTINFTGNFIGDEDLPSIVLIACKCSLPRVILRNTDVSLNSNLSDFSELVETSSIVDISLTPAVKSLSSNQPLIEIIERFPEKIIWLDFHMLVYKWTNLIQRDLHDKVRQFHELFYTNKLPQISEASSSYRSNS